MQGHQEAQRTARRRARRPRPPARATTRMCAALAVAAIVVLAAAANAAAGEWVQVSCINPNQTGAGSAGWISMIAGGGYGSNSDASCGPGSPMFAILSSDVAVSVGSAETLVYTPPAGSTLTGGTIDVALYADGHGPDASGTAVAYTPEYAYDGSNVFFQCAWGLTPCAPGSNDFTGQIELPAGKGGNLYLSAGCGSAQQGTSCDEGASNGAWSLVNVYWANLRLSNSANPAATSVSGPLLQPGARGTQELALTATDYAGPGVYNVTVQADGHTLYSGTPDSNGGLCVPAGSSRTALMFDASQPCKQSESVAVPANTAGVSDGQHTLKVTVTDAAGNTSVVYDGSISTHNAPTNAAAPTITAAGELLPGGRISAQPGEWSAPDGTGAVSYAYQWQHCDGEGGHCQIIPGAEGSGYTASTGDIGHTVRALITATDSDGSLSVATAASDTVAAPPPPAESPGAPNGTGAGEDAQIRITGPAALVRSFAGSALTITGQLISSAGAPIGGATLDVREQMQGSSSIKVLGHVTSTSNGAFTVRVPAGPSRHVLLDYRAFSGDASYTGQAGVQESVAAGVRLRINHRLTSRSGRIVLSGTVNGPIPPQGVVVEMLVHYRGRWEPFRDPRTNRSGRFRMTYQFEGAVGRFPFRAEVLDGQAGFPYTAGESTAIYVETS